MSLAAFVKKYGKEAIYGAEHHGPMVGLLRNQGGILGKGGLKDIGEDALHKTSRYVQENPEKALAMGAGATGIGYGLGGMAAHEDQDTPGHKVDDLLRKLGIG